MSAPAPDRRQIYDQLYEAASALFRAYDPCRFEANVCAAGLEDGCCLCPDHRAGQACTRRSLGCKLHVCDLVELQMPELCRRLAEIRAEARRWGLPVEVFSTLEQR